MQPTGKEPDDVRPEAIGGMVRALRKRLGLRQGDLAKKTGMSAAQLCHIEKDRNAPSMRTLRRIADALGVPLADLADDREARAHERLDRLMMGEDISEICEEPAPGARFAYGNVERSFARANTWLGLTAGAIASAPMSLPSTPPREPDFADSLRPVGPVSLADLPPVPRGQVRRRIEEYRELEKRAGVPVHPSLPLDYPAEVGAGDAEALAAAVRRAAGVADAVLFDSIALLENKGLRVVAADLPEKVDAFALWDEPARNVWLMIRKDATDERQQFRAACALADVLRFVAGGAREPIADTPLNRRFAREFASAFLMPAAALRELCYRLGLGDESWTWNLLLREKQRYGVSAEAFAYRLEALGLLKPSLRQDFVRRIRDWYESHGFAEPSPSARKALRHSRYSDLKMLVR